MRHAALDPNPMTRNELLAAIDGRAPWCLTLACPLEPANPDRAQIRIKLRHLIEEAERLLAPSDDSGDVQRALAPLHACILDDDAVPRDGASLVALISESTQRVTTLPFETAPLVAVSDRFEVGQLAADFERRADYHILTVSDDGAHLMHVGPFGARKIHLPLAREDRAAANAERVSPVVGGSAHANRFGKSPTSGSPTVHMQGFGHERRDKIERQTWYQVIADALREVIAHDDGGLVAIVADATHHGALMDTIKVPRNAVYIDHNPESVDEEALLLLTEAAAKTHVDSKRQEIDATVIAAVKDERVCTDLQEAWAAAANGRIELLVIQQGPPTYGKRVAEGRVETHDAREDGDIELISALIAETLARGGRLVTLDSEDTLPVLPEEARFNAVLRW